MADRLPTIATAQVSMSGEDRTDPGNRAISLVGVAPSVHARRRRIESLDRGRVADWPVLART